jgi:hypothetical protein
MLKQGRHLRDTCYKHHQGAGTSREAGGSVHDKRRFQGQKQLLKAEEQTTRSGIKSKGIEVEQTANLDRNIRLPDSPTRISSQSSGYTQ